MNREHVNYPKKWKPIFSVPDKFYWPFKNMNPDHEGFVHLTWWRFDKKQSFGGYDSYLSALASQSGYWEEYCEHNGLKR